VQGDLEYTLKRVEIVGLGKKEHLVYARDGVTFRPTLAPVARLMATYEGKGDLKKLSTSYLIGVKDRRYYITLASPAK
jgi:hypothetical protein